MQVLWTKNIKIFFLLDVVDWCVHVYVCVVYVPELSSEQNGEQRTTGVFRCWSRKIGLAYVCIDKFSNRTKNHGSHILPILWTGVRFYIFPIIVFIRFGYAMHWAFHARFFSIEICYSVFYILCCRRRCCLFFMLRLITTKSEASGKKNVNINSQHWP